MSNIAPEVHAIDLDNTVYQTYPAFEKMAGMVVAAGLTSRDVIDEARAEVERSKGSFDLFTHLAVELKLPQNEIDGVAAEFGANEAGDDFLFADAHPFMIALLETATPNFIFTKGGLLTQTAKLKSVDLFDYWYKITDRTDKAGAVETMRLPDGTYAIDASIGDDSSELLVAKRVLVEEDKTKGFNGMAPQNGGWLVDRFDKFTQADIDTLPPHVVWVKDLSQATEYVYDMAERARH